MVDHVNETYKMAVAKTAETPIFFLIVICSEKTHTIGRMRSTRSDAELITDVVMLMPSMSTQCPGTSGSQNLRLGEHANIATNIKLP